MTNSNEANSAAVLVGRLIRSYRNSVSRDKPKLGQDALLSLMAESGEDYGIYDRTSVSKWENGKELAPKGFLEALGRTLNIPESEINLILAWYDPPASHEASEKLLAVMQSIESRLEDAQNAQEDSGDPAAPEPSADDAYAVARSALRKAALPGVYALAVGFMLNAVGLNGTAVVLAHALAAASLVTGQWALRWLKQDRDASEQETIADLFFISLFVTLNTPALIGAFTKADHFGFYTLGPLANTATPFVLMVLANLALSLAGTVTFGLLQRRQYGLDRGQNAFVRAVWITLPPLLLVYVNIIFFTNMGACIFFMIVFGVLFGAFTAIIALNEPGMKLGLDGFVLKATILVIILLCASGVAGMLMGYMEPDIVLTAADLRVIPLGTEALGYTAEERVERLRLGILWMSLATIAYLAVVVGGYLLMTVRRATSQNPENVARQVG